MHGGSTGILVRGYVLWSSVLPTGGRFARVLHAQEPAPGLASKLSHPYQFGEDRHTRRSSAAITNCSSCQGLPVIHSQEDRLVADL